MSIADKITRLQNAKTAIANAITGKGGTVASGDGFEDFAADIGTIPEKEDATWNQCPTAVKNYLTNVTYNPSDYTTSQIANYAPATAVASNTKPIGKTIDGTTFYNEVPNVKTPFATTNKGGTIKPLDSLRWVNTSYAVNVRDIGGWTCDGGTVKYGKIFRGGIPNSTDKALIVDSLGAGAELDFIWDYPETSDRFNAGIDYYCATQNIQYSLTNINEWKKCIRFIFDAVKGKTPVYMHCIYGADRTGSMACIIEGMLGVSQSDCDKDYELTTFSTGSGTDATARRRNETDWTNFITAINAVSGSTFRDKCVNFVASLGFTAAEINAFRAAMINGNPATVTPSVGTATITNTLTNVSSDNSDSSITKYQPYKARLTPSSNYLLDSVSVTMGGTSVTADCAKTIANTPAIALGNHYAEINIERATGNVVITASAIQYVPPFTNLVPTSVYTDGNVYNGVGYKDNTRLRTNGLDEAALNGVCATGFIDVAQDDVLYVKGITFTDDYCKIVHYNSAYGAYANSTKGQIAGSSISTLITPEKLADDYYKFTAKAGATTYPKWRFTGYGTGENVIITKNEPIE